MQTALIPQKNASCPGNCEHPLLQTIKELAQLRSIPEVIHIVKIAARGMLRADGVTFVLREGDQVYYADENAISPLWKGQRFPASACISGWVMQNRESVFIEDITLDSRIPQEAYRPTFVRSLAMVPVCKAAPIAAIGAYWAQKQSPTATDMDLLQSLAEATGIAIRNAELYHEAQQAIQVRNDFIGIASHELLTPLTPVRIQLRLASKLSEKTNSVELAKLLNGIDAQIQRMARLVDDLLDIGQIVQNSIRIEPEEIIVPDFFRNVLGQFQPQMEASGSIMTMEVEPLLRANWDKRRIEQVLVNLLSNAIKFGRGRPIHVAAKQNEDFIEILVRDEGLGISPKDHKRIFEKFERTVSSRHFGGFGMGLWIVRKIIEAHQGTIHVSSQLEQGSTFVVRLPKAVKKGVTA